ncbi:hypothetical protein OESDEN_11193 [Oesophagostomum dentatum]|uniref:Symplekin/Pta1 N-terminal domain-containing protein n=1 Tax=Oesophagostomum dentatum TaxID=61180 RepID=A0A0B1SUK1_OESDE|nr:hypothetical protein OESDEN_11193 [Oesophagostomum dentatum]
MGTAEHLIEPLESNDSKADRIGELIRGAQSTSDIKQKLDFLDKAQLLILSVDSSDHLLDNFLDEMLEFTSSEDFHLRCFSAGFIEKACKKDADVLKKAITHLSYLLMSDSQTRGGVMVMKRVITVCANIYPYILKWACGRKADGDAEKCWEAFSLLKGRIVSHADSDNEGIRTMTFKFLETVVLCQSPKTEESDTSRGEDVMSLSDVPRDHRFISYRKLQSEAAVNLQSLMDQTTLPHISAQNLLTVLTVLCNVARRRPEYMARILDCLEALHINLPPTLGASQVKSMRKELKAHLLRILKHSASLPLHPRITTLLTDLGASQGEINRNMPPNIAELRKKASKRQSSAEEPAAKKKSRSEEGAGVVLDDDEYQDDEPSTSEGSVPIPDSAHQSAIDITAEWIYERLNPKLVANLVLISLVTLPDEMPAAFASSFTQIATAGTEQHRRHLARSMATQATAQELGPGAEQMRKEKLAKFMERQSARRDGVFIPPTPAVHLGGHQKQKPPLVPIGALPGPTPAAPPSAPKVKQQFNLFTNTKELSQEEMESLFDSCFMSIMKAERRARQGGTMSMHHVVLVRIATRFHPLPENLYNELIEFIVDVSQHRYRTDLALLWVTELYSQYQGFTVCFNHDYMSNFGRAPKKELFAKFDTTLCTLLQKLMDKGQHKEALFHKLLLDCPLVTSNALKILEKACIDDVYCAFGITTLRELLLTRNRQRSELIDLLFRLSFYDKAEIKQLCVDTLKELCSLKYMHRDIRLKLIEQLNECTLPTPPPHFTCYNNAKEFNESIYRSGIHLYLAVLPLDTSLLFPLAEAYTKSSTLLKKITLRSIEFAIKAIGMDNQDMLHLLEECPVGAESFVARVVHLLTERHTATKEVVARMKKLHEDRNTDVRSLIPILNGLERAPNCIRRYKREEKGDCEDRTCCGEERQSARRDGVFIPPTPAVHLGGHQKQKPPLVPIGALPGPTPAAPPSAPKVKQQFNLFTNTKELSQEEMESLFDSCFMSIMKAERRARQGGTMSMHHVVLVRIATRFHPLPEKLYNELIEFIVDVSQHRYRTDLALLWVTELYSQYQGFTVCFNHDYMSNFGRAPKKELFAKFDTTLCTLLQKLMDKGQHKEALFHKLLLDCPLVTSNALKILEKACIDDVYCAFGITTLRELLLTRNRQRSELIDLLFRLSFYDKAEIKQLCVDTLKELCSLKYMHRDIRLKLIEQLNECTLSTPPPHFTCYNVSLFQFFV